MRSTESIIIPITGDREYRQRIYMIHDLLGSLPVYTSLAERIKNCSVFGVILPSLSGEQANDIIKRSELYAQEIRKHGKRRLYNIVGYSLGGILAVEVARRLREMGEDIGMVGVIDTPPLHSLHGIPMLKYISFLNQVKNILFRLEYQHDEMEPAGSDDKVQMTKSFMVKCKADIEKENPPNKQLLFLLMSKIMINLFMQILSTPPQYIDCDLAAKVAVFSTQSTADDFSLGRDLGWKEAMGVTGSGIDVELLPDWCDHHSILSDEFALTQMSNFFNQKIKEMMCEESLLTLEENAPVLALLRNASIFNKRITKIAQHFHHLTEPEVEVEAEVGEAPLQLVVFSNPRMSLK